MRIIGISNQMHRVTILIISAKQLGNQIKMQAHKLQNTEGHMQVVQILHF